MNVWLALIAGALGFAALLVAGTLLRREAKRRVSWGASGEEWAATQRALARMDWWAARSRYPWLIAGYVMEPGDVMGNGDVIAPEAFKESALPVHWPSVCLCHNVMKPLGRVRKASVSNEGLYATVEVLTKDWEWRAFDPRKHKLRASCVVKAERWDAGMRLITDMEILEISVVPLDWA